MHSGLPEMSQYSLLLNGKNIMKLTHAFRFKLPVLFVAVSFLILTSFISAHAVPAGTVKTFMDAAYDGDAARH